MTRKISSGVLRREEHGKRPSIVASMEKLGRRRKLEVRGGFSHHLATNKVQETDVTNQRWVDLRLCFALILPLIFQRFALVCL